MLIRWIIAVLFVVFMGCAKEKGHDARLSDADELFAAGEYEEALTLYEELVVVHGPVARVGAGWSRIRLHRYTEATADFALANTGGGADGMAGWSFCLWATADLTGGIEKAEDALSVAPNWMLRLDSRVNAQHLLWIQSASYFELGDYSACVSKIRFMQGQSSYNPNLSDPMIAEELAEKLQNLGSALGKTFENRTRRSRYHGRRVGNEELKTIDWPRPIASRQPFCRVSPIME